MPNDNASRTYGLELEKPFAARDGSPFCVGDAYFRALEHAKTSRGEVCGLKELGGRLIGVSTRYGEESLDNSFLLGESATGPIADHDGGLARLSDVVSQELHDVVGALAQQDAVVINMANHPLAEISDRAYSAAIVPKPVYSYLRTVRGWNHVAGINARSQNSPSVGVEADESVRALNCILGMGAGLIALYANSPFEEGAATSLQESRLNLWDDMFGAASFSGDRRLHIMPDKPFTNLRDYFQWMFPPDRPMLFVPGSGNAKSEKNIPDMVVPRGNPSLLEYMQAESWHGTVLGTEEEVVVRPSMSQFALHQFLQFTGARIRYGLKDEPFSVDEFNDAMSRAGDEVDTLFAQRGAYFYIEGRDPGTNFPDQELYDTAGERVAQSVVMSAAALHVGAIRNLDGMDRLVREYGWDVLMGLRKQAIIQGLGAEYAGRSVVQLCESMLDIAADGLHADEQRMLAYPEYVLRSGMNGADRARIAFEQAHGTDAERIRSVVRGRALVMPDVV